MLAAANRRRRARLRRRYPRTRPCPPGRHAVEFFFFLFLEEVVTEHESSPVALHVMSASAGGVQMRPRCGNQVRAGQIAHTRLSAERTGQDETSSHQRHCCVVACVSSGAAYSFDATRSMPFHTVSFGSYDVHVCKRNHEELASPEDVGPQEHHPTAW